MIVDRYAGRKADELKRDENALADVLREAGAEVKRRDVRCPFCDDKKPSGSIYSNGNGFAYKCHKCGFGGSILDVIAKVDGIEVAEVFKQLKGDTRSKQKSPTVYPDVEALKAAMPFPVDTVYQYTHPATGKTEMLVLRLLKPDGNKTFRQARPQGSGFVQQAPAKPWPLYNWARIQNADTVVCVEGERCVDALTKYVIAATTSPGGAKNAAHADWGPLSGKNIILWGDNDDEGRRYIAEVERQLQTLEHQTRISILDPASLDLGPKEDVADFIEQLKTVGTDDIRGALHDALRKAKPKGMAAAVAERIEAAIEGRIAAIRWPWEALTNLTKSLRPGSITLLCGSAGASKSFMLLQALAFWLTMGVKVIAYALEETQSYHLQRCLAQRVGIGDLTDLDWIKQNPAQARRAYADNSDFLESFGRCLWAGSDSVTLEQLSDWIEKKAKAGFRIICADPVTAAVRTKEPYIGDPIFLRAVGRAAEEHGCSVLLVTHPVKAVSGPDMSQIAGGAAYTRHSQAIVWLESHDPKTSKVKTALGTTQDEHNRTLHVLKARDGRGTGLRLAYQFESESLTLKELGLILKKTKEGN